MPKPRKRSTGRKTHAFDDCSGKFYSREEDVVIVANVEDVTCGLCKQRILNVIAEMNWQQLSLPQVALLSACMNHVKASE